MNWFLITLIAPALWSIGNHVDKYLIAKFFKGSSIGALIIFSSLIGLCFVPIIPLFHPEVFSLSPAHALGLIVGSAVYISGILLYLYALKNDEASIVVPLFQIVPVFLFFLGYFFLDEVLTSRQILGALLIILSSVTLSLDLSNKRPKLKAKLFFLMLFSSCMFAVSDLIFKAITLENNFWTTTFWSYIGELLMALILFLCIKQYRREFMIVFKKNTFVLLVLNTFNEMIGATAILAFRFATLLAPLALVSAVNGFQPFFVFLFGTLLTLFAPHLGKESLLKKDMVQKFATIAVMIIGTYILHT